APYRRRIPRATAAWRSSRSMASGRSSCRRERSGPTWKTATRLLSGRTPVARTTSPSASAPAPGAWWGEARTQLRCAASSDVRPAALVPRGRAPDRIGDPPVGSLQREYARHFLGAQLEIEDGQALGHVRPVRRARNGN